jgi:hypothetical protein
MEYWQITKETLLPLLTNHKTNFIDHLEETVIFASGNSRKHSSEQLSHDVNVVPRNRWIGHCQGWTEAGNRSGKCLFDT